MTKQDAAILPLLRALRDGAKTAAEVATTTGRSKASAHASLSAMAATAGRARAPLVCHAGVKRDGKLGFNLYALTDAGLARLLEADGQGAGT